MAEAGIEHGYLVLADVSGYTAFLASTELDHAMERRFTALCASGEID